MKRTPIEIREMQLKKRLLGYDVHEVEALREFAAEALEDAFARISELDEQLRATAARLSEHEKRESVLRDAVTTAQKMADDLREAARKEASLIVSEARGKAEELTARAHDRAMRIQDEISRLDRRRRELCAALRSTLDYYRRLIDEEAPAERDDAGQFELRFLSGK
ncbi:MAG TPA: DivIVA domain-containing protein [Deltaproteobacteria bacterium]|nr:DivIVA domain-containing protein [Deltaproteobacteria bacterium]